MIAITQFQYSGSESAYKAMVDWISTDPRCQSGFDKGRVWLHNAIIAVTNPTVLDIAAYGEYHGGRWSKFLRDYLEPESVREFIRSCVGASPSEEKLLVCASNADHKQGNCLVAFTYHQSTLTVFSRSSIWVPTATLDLSIAALLAQHISAGRGGTPTSVIWHISQLQLHINVLLPYVAKFNLLSHYEKSADDVPFCRELVDTFRKGLTVDPSTVKYKRLARMYRHMQRLVVDPVTPWSFIPTLPKEYLP